MSFLKLITILLFTFFSMSSFAVKQKNCPNEIKVLMTNFFKLRPDFIADEYWKQDDAESDWMRVDTIEDVEFTFIKYNSSSSYCYYKDENFKPLHINARIYRGNGEDIFRIYDYEGFDLFVPLSSYGNKNGLVPLKEMNNTNVARNLYSGFSFGGYSIIGKVDIGKATAVFTE